MRAPSSSTPCQFSDSLLEVEAFLGVPIFSKLLMPFFILHPSFFNPPLELMQGPIGSRDGASCCGDSKQCVLRPRFLMHSINFN